MEKGAWDFVIFSIIVPVCNAETFLKECVESAAGQDMSFLAGTAMPGDFYEVILVENGSSDNSVRICDELAAEYPMVRTIHLGRIGLFAARQAGIRNAKGEYIISLDADDALKRDALKELSAVISSFDPRKDAPDVIIYDACEMHGSGKRLSERPFDASIVFRGADKKKIIDKFCSDDSLNSMWTKCVKKSIAQLDKTDIFLNYGEDLYQSAVYYDKAEGIMYLDKVLYEYRTDSVSMSTTYSEMYLDNEKITWSMLDKLADKWEKDTFTDIISRRKSLTCTIAVTRLIGSRHSMREKKYKLDKLLADPFYNKYSDYPLPDWAGEEAVAVKKLQVSRNPGKDILGAAFKMGARRWVKERLRHGI